MTDKQKNFIKAKAIAERNKERIKEQAPNLEDRTGIYVLTREENGLHYGYVGKAQKQGIVSRLAQHLSGYDQWIDKSIRKHGLFSEDNINGWRVLTYQYCRPDECDEAEREFIVHFANQGYQLRNVESGGTTGKTDINERKPARGYRDGVKQGERNAIKKIAHWFDKHLKADYRSDKPSKNAIKALDQFNQLLQGATDND
ncbi:MAG: GIY-YIG nuclease family protein [Clostridiales bacterium]|nr:GIY-YIG nuclease family protein [Clostridiales bacterium]